VPSLNVQLDQVEGVEEDGAVMPPIPDAIEAWHALVIAAHGLAVDYAGARAQPSQRLHD
jgi:hypothetical protein